METKKRTTKRRMDPGAALREGMRIGKKKDTEEIKERLAPTLFEIRNGIRGLRERFWMSYEQVEGMYFYVKVVGLFQGLMLTTYLFHLFMNR